jgi:hypothetical protein
MSKQEAIERKQKRDAIFKILFIDAVEEHGNTNEHIAREIKAQLGYETMHLFAPPSADLKPGFIIISNEGDDSLWVEVKTQQDVDFFIDYYYDWDLKDGNGVVIVY